MYQGIPLLAKWLTISNGTGKPVKLNTFTSEILAAVEYESLVGEPDHWEYENITTFIAQTGLDLLEHDGSYPGDVCASRSHPGHHGLGDSQWKQWKKISDFYKWCRTRGVYLNVPDWYFLSGSNKSAMGYREVKGQLKLPLYYTGLTRTARIREQREKNKKYRLDREYNVEIPISIAPGGVTWFVIE